MERLERYRQWIGGADLWVIVAAMAVALLMILAATEAQGQTFTVLHEFTGSGGPDASLTFDAAGSLYGTAVEDGGSHDGQVFKLIPGNGGWAYTDLHDFTGSDGALPSGSVVLDFSGDLYGTTPQGGSQQVGVTWGITP